MKSDIIPWLIKQQASSAVGSSTLRGGVKGTVEQARKSLMTIEIGKYSSASAEHQFLTLLEKDTKKIMKSFPLGARENWGAARKVINIFLRNLTYNKYTCEACKLVHIEKWLEVPLDSYVAKGLRNTQTETGLAPKLPRWHGIKRLKKENSNNYQVVASKIAEKKGINKVDLDICYWRNIGREYLKDC
jgi:hypothetical protein